MKRQGTETLKNLIQRVDYLKLLLLVIGFCCLMVLPTLSFAGWTVEAVDAPRMFSSSVAQRAIAVDGSNRPHIAYGGDHLYHAYFDGIQWKYEVVDNAPGDEASNRMLGSISIALDSNNKVHISYINVSNSNGVLKYATNASGSWAISTIDSSVFGGGGFIVNTSIALDSNNKVHISYYDDAHFVIKYATNSTGSWVTTTIDCLLTDVPTGGNSIAVDSNNKVHISYSSSSSGQLKHATNASGSWVIETVDSTGNVGWGTPSIAVDSNNKVHISYYDWTNYDLKYATNASGSWVISTIDSSGYTVHGRLGGDTSIVLDSNNKVHISYYEYSNNDLKYATNASGSWVIQTVDSVGDVGWDASIALDSNNKVHISYCDWTSGKPDLKYATNASGSWVISTIDSSGYVGENASIALDSNNKVHISYFERNILDSWNSDLKYATNASGSWVIETVSSGVGTISIALDSNNKVHLSYFDYDNSDLKYATNASGSWVIETVVSSDYLVQYYSLALDSNNKVHISYNSGYPDYDLKYATNASGSWVIQTVDSTRFVGPYNSIALDSNNKVHISYFNPYPNADLMYATNASGPWVIQTVDSYGYVGIHTSIALDSNNKVHISYIDYDNYDLKYATNSAGSWVIQTVDSSGGSIGGDTSIALDSNNKVHISYYDDYPDSDLKYATNASGSWVTSTIDSSGDVGCFNSMALDTNNKVHISYFDYTNYDLRYATNAYVKVCFPDRVCSPDSDGSVEFPSDTEQPPTVTVTTGSNNPGGSIWDFHVIGSGGTSLYYDISANPPSTGPMRVCITYDDTGLTANQEASLKIKHWDGSGWGDETCPAPPDNPDTINNKICACVDHLSWFAVGYEVSTADVVTLITPNGDEMLPSGGPYAICWQAPLEAAKFDLKYSVNNGTNWNFIKTVTGLHCTHWEEVPVVTANKKKCRVKVIGYDSIGTLVGEDISDKPFTIDVLRVLSPNGEETLQSGNTWTIRWATHKTIRPVAKTVLKYTTNGTTWNKIKTLSGNPGTYNWTVPAESSTKCKVKVVLKDASGVNIGSDVSDKVFTIQP